MLLLLVLHCAQLTLHSIGALTYLGDLRAERFAVVPHRLEQRTLSLLTRAGDSRNNTRWISGSVLLAIRRPG